MLSDVDIIEEMRLGNITIDPFDENRLQPASYDVLLGFEFLVFDNTKTTVIDPKASHTNPMRKIVLDNPSDFLILHPGEFILGVTYEKIGINNQFSYEIMGKSSLARLGLIVHTTAGFIDPGNNLKVTLEMVNFNNVPLKLYPKMKIGQVAFTELRTPSAKSYGDPSLGSKYYNAEEVQASAMHKNFITED